MKHPNPERHRLFKPWALHCVLLAAAVFFAVVFSVDAGRPAFDIDDPIYRGYPTKFHGMGTIDRIGDGDIVIGDSLYRLSRHVTYNIPGRVYAPLRWMSVGAYVGFVENSAREIVSIWLLKAEN